MLTLSETVVLLPRWSRGVLPFWKRFVQAWDDLFDTGMRQMERRKETVSKFDSRDRKLSGFQLRPSSTRESLKLQLR